MSNEWRELKTLQDVATAQAAGDEIEVMRIGDLDYSEWRGIAWSVSWSFRARPRPKTKKVKIYGYLDTVTGRTFTVVRGVSISGDAVPYPKLDDEIEVEE